MKAIENLSFWLKEALPLLTSAPVQLEQSQGADICIVGGGFTGLWSAIEIKRRDPGARVVIVERDICGSGASDRNGGFVLSLWAKFLSLQKICGTEEAIRLARASSDAVVAIGDFCAAHNIDCDYRLGGWLWSATSTAQIGTWDETLATLKRLDVNPFEQPSPESIGAMSGSSLHLAGVIEPIAASLQPAKLAFGLRRVAQELGVEIFEHSPMIALRHGSRAAVVCEHGTISAERVIVAQNAWGVMHKEIRKSIAVVSSDIVITKPIESELIENGWRSDLSISDSRMLVEYYRTTPQGRVVFGKGGGSGALAYGSSVGSKFDGSSPIADLVVQHMRRAYPVLGSAPIEQSWTGPIDRSKHGLPIFGQFENAAQVLFGVGYSGNGVGPSVIGGKILAALALDARDEWAQAGLVQPLRRSFPPEPFRYLGGKVVRAAVARRDSSDDDGRKAGPIVRALASLAPAGLSPVRADPPTN